MKERFKWKKVLSVLLSAAMVAGLIGVAGPKQANAADANMLTNGGFDNASEAWKDQDGTLVGAQEVVDDVKITNLMESQNGGFENGITGWTPSGTAKLTSEKASEGNQSIKMTCDGSNQGYIESNQIDVEAEKTYKVSYKLYIEDQGDGNDAQCYALIYAFDASGNMISGGLIDQSGRWASTGAWETISFDYTTPAGAKRIRIDFMHNAVAGTSYWDDVQITLEEAVYADVKKEYLNNGGFENGTTGWSPSGTAKLTSEKASEGNQSIKMTCDGSNQGYIESNQIDVEAEKTYKVSYKLYIEDQGDGNDAQCYALIYAFDASGNMISGGLIDQSGRWASTGAWETISFDYTTPAGAKRIRIDFMHNAVAGTSYWDDASIYTIERELAKTYTEGIGTCNEAESDNVLAMKDYIKVTQDVTIKKGNRYDYSFMVKSENAGEDLAFGVTAGDNATDAVTVTSDWKEVTDSFTATADATEFGFTRGGTGTVLIDDVVLNETVTGPTDHTSMPGGGAYVPEGQYNVLSGAISDFSSDDEDYSLNGVGSIENGMLKITASGDKSVQTRGIPVVANETYTFSCYAWVQDTVDTLKFNIYYTEPEINWKDYACATSITADTEGWTLLTCEVTPTKTGDMYFGLRNYEGSGTIYVDDVALTKKPSDHTTVGTVDPLNLATNGDFNVSEGELGFSLNGNAIQDGKCILTTSYVQKSINVTAEHTYRMTYYIWVCNANNLKYDMYIAGDGSPEGSWKDYAFTYDQLTNRTHTSSITENTGDWQKVSFEWTAKGTGWVNLGFRLYEGTGTVYLDDVTVHDITPKTEVTISASVTGVQEAGGYQYITVAMLDGQLPEEAVGQSGGCALMVGGESKAVEFNLGSTTFATFSGVTEYVNAGQTIKIPASVAVSTERYNLTIEFGAETTLEKIGTAYGTYMKVHEYPDGDNRTYFNIDNGTVYTLSSTNNAFAVTQNGVDIGKTVGDSLDVAGVYDIERIENGERFTQQIVLYKNGDVHVDDVIDSKDLVAMKRIVANVRPEDVVGDYAADLNRSGTVDATDLLGLRRALVSTDANTALVKAKGESSLNGEMPIIGYNGPDYDESRTTANASYKASFVDDEIFSMVKDLGFNTVIFNRNDFGDQLDLASKTLELSEKYGFKAYLQDAYVSSPAGNGTTLTSNAKMEGRNAKYDSYKSFGGYYIYDEPLIKNPTIASQNRPLLSSFTTQLGMMKKYTNVNGYCNLFPIISPTLGWAMQSSTSGVSRANYQNYMQAAIDGGSDVLSYDLYLRDNDGKEISREGFYKNIDEMRTMSASSGIPFMSFVQVGTYFDGKKKTVNQSTLTTVQEMYLEANAPLAMGAKGISYYSLIQSIGNAYKADNSIDLYRSGLINVAGQANYGEATANQANYDYYTAAKKINTYIAKIDEVLMNATSKGVIPNSTIQSYLSGANTNLTAYGAVMSVTGTNALVGCFDYYGKNAYMVVNTSTSASETITLNMADTTSYTYTGMDCASQTGSGTLTLTNLGAGESVLVVVD